MKTLTKFQNLFRATICAGALIASGGFAAAQSIWTNPITGMNPNTVNPYTAGQTVNSNITVSGIGRGSGAVGTNANDRYNANSWNTAAIDLTAYFTFTLTPNSGYAIDFTSLTGAWQRSGTGPESYAVRSSLDGFSSNIAAGAITGSGSEVAMPAINLGAAAFDNVTGPIEFRIYAWGTTNSGGTFSVNNFTFNGTVNPLVTGNNTTLTASTSTVAFGRVMAGSANPANNVTINKTGTDTTTYTVTAGGSATVADNGASFAGGAQSDPISVGIDRSTTGAKTGTVTVDNTAADSAAAGQGSADANDVINVSATVVDDRVITASGVDLGKVLVGATTGPQATSLTTTGDDNNNTRVTVNATGAAQDGVTVAAGASQLFNDATDTTSRGVTGNFATSGSKNVDVNLSVTGEGLSGESVNNVTVTATAEVYQAADLTVNNAGPIFDGGSISVANAGTTDGGQRAAAAIISKSVTGEGWSVSGLDEGTVIDEGGSAGGAASFDRTGKLNGTHLGSLVLGFEHADQDIQGTSAGDLGFRDWDLSHTISGNVAATGSAAVRGGQGYAGFGLTNGSGAGTEASLLAGSAGGDSNISITFSTGNPGASNDGDRVSDVVNLEGSGDDLIVMSLSYDPADISLGGYASEEELKLGWLSEGKWVMAVEGNTGNNAGAGQQGFVGSFAAFQALHGTNLSNYIGAFGVDTANNEVWAVINHNSEFAVVPEPGAAMLLAVAGVAAVVFRRRPRA